MLRVRAVPLPARSPDVLNGPIPSKRDPGRQRDVSGAEKPGANTLTAHGGGQQAGAVISDSSIDISHLSVNSRSHE